MRLFLALAMLLSTVSAQALIPTTDFKFLFDRLPGQPIAQKYYLGTTLYEYLGKATCLYDYTKLGGSDVANINLKQTDNVTNCTLPSRAVVYGGFIDVISAIAPASAYVTLGFNTITDILGSTRGTNMAGGLVAVVPVYTAATAVKIVSAASTTLKVKITSTTATGGKFRVFLNYVISQ